MDRDTAENILETLAWMDFPMMKYGKLVKSLKDNDEKEKLLGYFKQIFSVHYDLMTEVIKKYPELDPLAEGESHYFNLQLKYQTEEYPAYKMTEKDKLGAKQAGLKAAEEIHKENI